MTTWAFLGLTALTATAVGWRPSSLAPDDSLSLAPAPVREPPADVSAADLLSASQVSLKTLLTTLEAELEAAKQSPDVQADFLQLLQGNDLPGSERLIDDYIRVKLAFEATRDAGWWYLRWDITDREPNSDAIWSRWGRWSGGQPVSGSAVAECDELSALFAFIARGLGVEEVGLFWPTANHTVAVWSPQADVRLVVPTTQLFLSPLARLGTAEMDPWTQKTIYNYTRKDVADDFTIPGELAAFFQLQSRRYLSASESTLQLSRNLRGEALRQHWDVDEIHSAIDRLQDHLRHENASNNDLAATDRLRIELTSRRALR